MHEEDLTADDRVARFVKEQFLSSGMHGEEATHLRQCPGMGVGGVIGNDGTYGCDTGCEYARLEAQIGCPHYPVGMTYIYGDFGDLADILGSL